MLESTHFGSGKDQDRVTIDAAFFWDHARDAVRQFFRPVTDPFKPDPSPQLSPRNDRFDREQTRGKRNAKPLLDKGSR